MQNGGQLLVQSLVALGATRAFGVPGESYLAVLDALHDTGGQLDFTLCRNEGGAAFMAAAWGKLTGSPGICMVTRGPGVTNASIGIHTAMQDSAPMIIFVGQVGTDLQGREAFQEIDYRAVFGTMAKWAVEITHVDRIPEILSRAWMTALSGRPGPVVIALPEDMLTTLTATPPLTHAATIREPSPDAATLDDALALLRAAQRPLILLGGCNWTDAGRQAMQAFAEASDIPVLAAFRFQDRFDNHSAVYAGEAGVGMPPHVRKLILEADTILALNIRFGEMTTDAYTLLDVPVPKQRLIHIHPSDREIGKIYQPTLGIQAGPNAFAAALRPISGPWGTWRENARAGYEASFDAPAQPSPVDMVAVTAHLREVLPDDVILTNGAGNFTVWPNKFFKFGPKARLLAPQSGAMGYGLPAAIAAKVAHPGSHSRLLCGGRRFSDELPGTWHRHAGGRAAHRVDPEQRHLWHHPRASGTQLPRPRVGHRSGQPRFQRACPCLWLSRRTGRDHRRLPRRLCPRAGIENRGGAGSEHLGRGDHPTSDPVADARQRPCGKGKTVMPADPARPPVRLGADIGGTFTDIVLEVGDRLYSTKILTDYTAPEQPILDGITLLLAEAGLSPADLDIVIHGTTLATNALIERRGARTAFVTTEGFRDVVEMRTENRFDQYDLNLRLPLPLVPREDRFPVAGRIGAEGQELAPLDEAALEALADHIAKGDYGAVAIGFIHSYMNPAHERRARDIIAARVDLPISISAEVSPQMREFERFNTVCANAYVRPQMADYLKRLQIRLAETGATCPVYMIHSGGGLIDVDTAAEFPVRLVESGPAGGAIFAADIARRFGLDRVVSYDMGGTTAKICLIEDFAPKTARSFEVARTTRFAKGSGMPISIPVIEMIEIGAGGGSHRLGRQHGPHPDRPGIRRIGTRPRLLSTRWRAARHYGCRSGVGQDRPRQFRRRRNPPVTPRRRGRHRAGSGQPPVTRHRSRRLWHLRGGR